MTYNTIIFRANDGIADIVLNRPEKMNAVSMELVGECLAALAEVAADEDVKVLIISGAGEKAFTAGDDTKSERDVELWWNLAPGDMFIKLGESHYYKVLLELRSLRKPVIAAVNGYCLGSGCELALACDIIIASDTAKFGMPFINIGVVSGTALLPRVVGYHRACELLFTGERITAIEAERFGMINRVVPETQLQSSAREMAQKLASQSTQLIGWTKWALNKTMSTSFPDALEHELSAMALTHPSRFLVSQENNTRAERQTHQEKRRGNHA